MSEYPGKEITQRDLERWIFKSLAATRLHRDGWKNRSVYEVMGTKP